MKKIFLLLLCSFLFGTAFAGKYDYDSVLVDKWFDKADDKYFQTPSECNPSAEEYESYASFGLTTGDIQERCSINLEHNQAMKEHYKYSGNRKDVHKYVSNFVTKYRGKKDIPYEVVNNAITFSVSQFKYGCAFIVQAWGFGINKMAEYNRNKYGDYYIDQTNETFIHDDPDFPVMDDLSRIGRRMDRLCQYPYSQDYIGKNEQEMTTKLFGNGPINGMTDEEKTELISGAYSQGYILFEDRYARNPVFGFLPTADYNNKLNESVEWMNENGLTKFKNTTDYMANKTLRRDEASKFFVQYATDVLKLVPDETKTECDKLSDLNKGWKDLKQTMITACKLGLFQGNRGKFMPDQPMTNAQAITILIRMVDGKKDETKGHFAKEYFKKAQELGITNGLVLNSSSNFDILTTRGEIGMLLYNTNTKGIVVSNSPASTPTTTTTITTTPVNTSVIAPTTQQTTCLSSQHKVGTQCVSNTKSCTKTNGIGQQTRNGSRRGSCTVVSCNDGYQVSNNSCVVSQQITTSQQTLPGCYSGRITFDYAKGDRSYVLGAGNAVFKTERSMRSDNTIYSYANSPLKGNALVTNITAIKNITNASSYTYSDENKGPAEGQIVVFKNANNIYMALKIIDITNDASNQSNLTGMLTFDYVIQGDGSTSFANCGSSSTVTTTCSSSQHLEGGSCVLNTKSCTKTNGIGQQSWNGSSRGSCTVVSCNNGYSLSNGLCTASQSDGKELVSTNIGQGEYIISSDQQYIYYKNNNDWGKLYQKSLSNPNAEPILVLDYVFPSIDSLSEFFLSNDGTAIYYYGQATSELKFYRKLINENGLGNEIIAGFQSILFSDDGNYIYYTKWENNNTNIYKKNAYDNSAGDLIMTIDRTDMHPDIWISDYDHIVYYLKYTEGKIYKRGFNENEGTPILTHYGYIEILVIPGGFIYKNPNDEGRRYKKLLNSDGVGQVVEPNNPFVRPNYPLIPAKYRGYGNRDAFFGNTRYFVEVGGDNLYKININ